MSTRWSWQVLLLLTAVAMGPATALAQNTMEGPYAPPDVQWPVPLYSNRPTEGGVYGAGEFLFMHQTNPLEHQLIAVRGFSDVDGRLTGVPGSFQSISVPPPAALFADDAGGPHTYQPGFDFTLGYKFANGVAVELNWWHLTTAKYPAQASLFPSSFNAGVAGENSFLFAPVYNFSPEYAGAPNKISPFIPNAPYGVWNGANVMQIIFSQRFDQYEVMGRFPIFDTDNFHTYGILGPRMAWFWDKFWWRTVDSNFDGVSGPQWNAVYTNIVSNRMYGVNLGCGTDWRLGDTPIGTFACSLDLQAAALIDFVKFRVQYERDDRFTMARRTRNDYRPVPEGKADLTLWWYPIEGVQLRVGYDFMAFFNTASSPRPVDFNFGSLTPAIEHEFRFVDGLHAGIAFIF